jgi:pyruvate dehydrogenase E1 component alpha subunit
MPASSDNPKWAEKRPSEDFYRILNPDGSLRGDRPAVDDAELLTWYRAMLRMRMFEGLSVRMQRRGELSVAASSRGEEAVGVGAAAALREGDWCFPSYRQMGALLYWKAPVDRMVATARGAPPEHTAKHLPLSAESVPRVSFAPYTVFLGASIPHAVGSALADKLNKRPIVTLAFLGDGATSEGDFYEGLNFAGVMQVPLVTIIQNNQWSISVPASRQTAAHTFAEKAVAVGIDYSRVDGNDVFAIYEKSREAVDRARRGKPSVIEAVTYRVGDHNTADASELYRGDEEASYWKTRDPVDRFEAYLVAAGLLNEAEKQRITAEMDTELRAAVTRGRQVPAPPVTLMFANHLMNPQGWSWKRQESEFQMELAGENPYQELNDELPS